MSSRPLIVITSPVLAMLKPAFEAKGLDVVMGEELADADRPRVRVIAAAGEFHLKPGYLESLPNLGLVAVVGVGYDGVDVPWCRARGIEVTAAPPGMNAEGVADHAWALILGGWRDLIDNDRAVRAGDWGPTGRGAIRPGLEGRQVGVVGLGAIGEAVARRAEAFRMRVSWWGPNPKQARWPRAASLLDLAQASDVLVICARATPDNRGLVTDEVIRAVGPGGMLVNVARGSLLDEDALIAALQDGGLGRAGLDVFAEEPSPPGRWAAVPNTVLSPHSAGATVESAGRMVSVALDNINAFLAGQPLLSPVP